MEELLSLKWNNHRSTFLHILGVLRDKQAYTDVTLACDGKFYSVHKLVLSTCSDYFCAMFDKTACKSPVIVLKDIKSEDLEALLDYMYLGEVNVRQSDLASLIKAAENLRIKGLAVPDDEPPKKGSVPASRTDSGRREGGSGSPPSKRKRRDEGEDGREDVRPPAPSTGGLHTPPPPSSRPKSPISQRLSSSPLRTSQESLMPEDRDSRPLSSPAESPVASHLTPHQSSQQLPHQSSQSSQPLPDQHEVSNQYRGEETPTFVKVEMEEETDDMQRDSYNMSGDGYKEENSGGDLGGDLSNDLPEFLQQAASGALASTSASYHHAFAGPSGFQPDVSGWQGDSQSLPGSFSGLGFQQPSSQDNPPGKGSSSSLLMVLHQTTDGSGGGVAPPGGVLNDFVGPPATTTTAAAPAAPSTVASHGGGSSSSFVCNMCYKTFLSGWELRRHLHAHADARPFHCPYCSHRSNFKHNLKSHIRSIHPGKPFFAFTVPATTASDG
ncbi:longitudinals lacking protein, isoforms H/M/V-like isoform X7 [Portunus trituberculatus]|uniref:longitudinals lacking protein, isoforms H/M/V-like isoform X7 n=1 Tax=Portunus trituberculatus TaxID=210409 RepID=UPI001E1CF356|nr:longitudinals lacking protein, isoforms H/M/V-like isoform X7 [Portunus trituberculatus]